MHIAPSDLVNALARHQGRENGIHIGDLTRLLGGAGEGDERKVRKLIARLRQEEGMAICGHPSTGYYMAKTPEELEQTCEFLLQRALHSLARVAQLRRVALPDLIGQLRINQA